MEHVHLRLVPARPYLVAKPDERHRPDSSRMPVWVSRTVVPIWSRKRIVATAFPTRLFKGIAVESSRSPQGEVHLRAFGDKSPETCDVLGICAVRRCPSSRRGSPACIHSRQCSMPVISATPFPRFLSCVSKVTPGGCAQRSRQARFRGGRSRHRRSRRNRRDTLPSRLHQ